MIAQDTINKIQDAIRIEEVIGDFVSLTRRGASYMACCPFHNEKTPSFVVTPSKGIYKCFGCGESGSAVSFLMKHEHMSFVEAMKYLAKKYHIEIVENEESAEQIAARQKTESLMLVNDFAAQFYVQNLETVQGKSVAMQYYRSRGLTEETIKKYGLGWSPSDAQELVRAATQKGYNLEYMVECGVLVKTDDDRYYDRFHERVVFPIHSVSGRVIAFSCRTLHAENRAKYVNSPTTPIYVKEKALFGIYFAKSEIAKQKKCYLVEGNLDVISLHQKGLKNVVASCGTALTPSQVQLIRRFTGEEGTVTVMYDGDGAGIKAAIKAIKLILAEGLNVKLLLFPDGQDPDDFCRHHSLEEVEAFVAENEQNFISYRASLLSDKEMSDPIVRAELINELADTIAHIPDPIKRTVYIQQCAARFSVEEQILRARTSRTHQKIVAELSASTRSQSSFQDTTPEPPPAPVQTAVQGSPQGVRNERRKKRIDNLFLAESALLSYILRYGTELLVFPSYSDFYNEGEPPCTVFDFIANSLEMDGFCFDDNVHRRIYDFYLQSYDDGLEHALILQRLKEGEDREAADKVVDLVEDKQELTINSLSDSMTQLQTLLAKYVPEELMKYAIAQMERKRKQLTSLWASAPDGMQKSAYAQQITSLVEKEKMLKQKIKKI